MEIKKEEFVKWGNAVIEDNLLIDLFLYFMEDFKQHIKAGDFRTGDIYCPEITNLDQLYDWYLIEKKILKTIDINKNDI